MVKGQFNQVDLRGATLYPTVTIMDSGNSGVRTESRGRNPTDTTVKDAVERYLTKKLESGASRTAMRPPLEDFAEYCVSQGIDAVDELTDDDLRDYGLELRTEYIDNEIAGSTANTYFRYIRAFLSFCVRDGKLDTNPADTEAAEEFLPEDTPTRDTQFWTPEQRKQLIAYADERISMAREETISVSLERAYRDRTIVVLLAELGLRGAECFRDPNDNHRDGLTWGDVDLEHGRLEVFGKSRKYETVGLTEAAHGALARLERIQEPPISEWPLFPTGHTASKYQAVEDATGDRPATGTDIDAVCREKQVAPPSITKEAGRQILKQLTHEAGIELEGDADYLQPHGARRALGAELYKKRSLGVGPISAATLVD